MNLSLKILTICLSVFYLMYLAFPTQHFPGPPNDALQSLEPGDTEDPQRRAYFTNLSRAEVIKHYQGQFLGNIPEIRLNHPPEDALSVIKEQTRSTFLEELVQPMRSSFYINGFEPTEDKDRIFIESRVWRQKITVRYVESALISRIFIGLLTIGVMTLVARSLMDSLSDFVHKA